MLERIILIPISIEHCIHCSQHSWFSRHTQQQYQQQFQLLNKQVKQLQQQLNKQINSNKLKINYIISQNEIPQHLQKIVDKSKRKQASCYDKHYQKYWDKSTNRVTRFPRIGAFEIQVNNILIFSKLNEKKFPSITQFIKILRGLAKESLKQFKNMKQEDQIVEQLKCLQPQLVKTINKSLIQPYKIAIESSQFKQQQLLLSLSQKTIYKHSLNKLYQNRKSTKCKRLSPHFFEIKQSLNYSTNLSGLKSHSIKYCKTHQKFKDKSYRDSKAPSNIVKETNISQQARLTKKQLQQMHKKINHEQQISFLKHFSENKLKKKHELQNKRQKQKGPFRRRHHQEFKNAYLEQLIPRKLNQQLISTNCFSSPKKNIHQLAQLTKNYIQQSKSYTLKVDRQRKNNNKTQITCSNTIKQVSNSNNYFPFQYKSLKIQKNAIICSNLRTKTQSYAKQQHSIEFKSKRQQRRQFLPQRLNYKQIQNCQLYQNCETATHSNNKQASKQKYSENMHRY